MSVSHLFLEGRAEVCILSLSNTHTHTHPQDASPGGEKGTVGECEAAGSPGEGCGGGCRSPHKFVLVSQAQSGLHFLAPVELLGK